MGSRLFETVELQEVVDVFDSGRKPITKSNRKAGIYPYYGASGITDYVESYLFDGEFILLSEDGDNLRSRNTPIAFIARGKFWVNNHAHIIQANKHNDTNYVCYALQVAEIDSYISGSTRPKITQADMRKIPVCIPPLKEQKAIAHILGSLDDKIELNRQMNKTLEAMAQALFKSWFVDFDPVLDNALAAGDAIPEELQARAARRAEVQDASSQRLPKGIQELFPSDFEFSEELGKCVPFGWRVDKFDTVAEVKYGKDHKKLEDGNIPVYGSGGIMRFANNSLYEGESVLIPRKGTLTNIMYVNEIFWSVDTMFFTKLKLPKHAKFLYYSLKLLDFNDMNVGSAVPSMTTKVLNDLNLILPNQDLVNSFDICIQDYYDKIEANTKQISSLTKLRDTLLPKLISGEVRVGNIVK